MIKNNCKNTKLGVEKNLGFLDSTMLLNNLLELVIGNSSGNVPNVQFSGRGRRIVGCSDRSILGNSGAESSGVGEFKRGKLWSDGMEMEIAEVGFCGILQESWRN